MSAERRLATLEGALSPQAATWLWLVEAHAFGSLPAYVSWLVEQPVSAAPLARVPAQAAAAARLASKGQAREAIAAAMRQATRDAIFLVELVIALNAAAKATTRREGLRYAACFWQLRALSLEANGRPSSPRQAATRRLIARWQAWRASVETWLTDLYAAAEARALLERRYLLDAV